MNILFLSGYNINPVDGGIARITHTLAELFIESGHCVWYLGYRKVSDSYRQACSYNRESEFSRKRDCYKTYRCSDCPEESLQGIFKNVA